MRRLFSDAHFDFIGWRRRAYLTSGLFLAVGLIGAIVWQIREGSWINYGVDFSGGTLIQIEFHQPMTVAELRAALPIEGEITRFGEENEFLIRTPQVGEGTSGMARVVPEMLQQRFGENSFTIQQAEAVGAKVSGELQQRAAIALLISFAATLLYLAIRFEWRFGVAAVVATVHDILLTMGLISVLQFEVSLATVAAVLTIVGYSLNDTIVIFDRIRENLHASRREDFLAILNRSVNETLPRTVLTSGTTLVTLFSLFLFGGEIIQSFAFILIVGIALGTYSSIFVAAPALLEIEKRWPGERKKGRVARTRAV